MSIKETPLAQIKRLHTNKETLIGTLVPALVGDDEDKDVLRERLLTASNAKLLRLAGVVESVKSTYGSKAKMIEAIGKAERKAKDNDYLAKLATMPLPKLFDMATSVERRVARS